jgi:hypothetical protein
MRGLSREPVTVATLVPIIIWLAAYRGLAP